MTFDENCLVTLIDPEREQILSELDKIKNYIEKSPEDEEIVVFMFWSGHGKSISGSLTLVLPIFHDDKFIRIDEYFADVMKKRNVTIFAVYDSCREKNLNFEEEKRMFEYTGNYHFMYTNPDGSIENTDMGTEGLSFFT
jgi:hypothetical protein